MRRHSKFAGKCTAIEGTELMGVQTHLQSLNRHVGHCLAEVVVRELGVIPVSRALDVKLGQIDHEQRGVGCPC